MTAPTTPRKAVVEYGDLGTRVYAQYPQDHPDESKRGRLIVREVVCGGDGCQSVLTQHGISRLWLEKLSPAQRQGFLEGCEVRADGSAYHPARCSRCERMMAL